VGVTLGAGVVVGVGAGSVPTVMIGGAGKGLGDGKGLGQIERMMPAAKGVAVGVGLVIRTTPT